MKVEVEVSLWWTEDTLPLFQSLTQTSIDTIHVWPDLEVTDASETHTLTFSHWSYIYFVKDNRCFDLMCSNSFKRKVSKPSKSVWDLMRRFRLSIHCLCCFLPALREYAFISPFHLLMKRFKIPRKNYVRILSHSKTHSEVIRDFLIILFECW